MHSIEELGTNVPAFLAKLWKIVEDPETNDLICWSPNGTSFYIRNQARFARELLPLYYKHNNMASFVRQLNMYGFHKVVSIEGGGLKVDKDEMEFAHQCFLMGHPYLLEHIKRKIPTSKLEEGRTGTKPELMNKVLADVKGMKGRQDNLDSQLSAMKRENEVLWREVAILRQKHLKQQQIVNKLIQFLVSMVQSSRNGGIGIKRHYPLMLNDTSHRPSKVAKGAELSDLNSAASSLSPTGPVIHELDAADLLEECNPMPTVTQISENYLPTDLCDVEITTENEGQSPNSNHTTSGSPDPTSSNPSPEVLLELAEECPLSPSMLLTVSPMEVSPAVVAPRISKGKLRSRASSTENKKRKSKKTSSNKTEPLTPAQDPLAIEEAEVNGVELLDAVLPTLVTENGTDLLQIQTNNKTRVAQSNEDALAAATDAAISAISNVAAANKDNSSKPSTFPNGKSVYKIAVKKNLPVTRDATSQNNKNIKNTKQNSSAMVIKQEPSTSNDHEVSSSDMALACTGNISEDSSSSTTFTRCGIPNELDNHVDNMQNELDSLRDLLKGDGYSLDANTLLGLFSDEPVSDLSNSGFEILPDEQDKENTTGNELATYSSNLLDMVEMFEEPAAGGWNSQNSSNDGNVMDISLSELNTPVPSVVSKKLLK